MGILLGFLLIFVVILIFLLGLGTGIGFLLHWLIPGVDMGTGILIGVLTIGMTIYFYARLTSMLNEDIPLEEPVIIDARPNSPFFALGPHPSRRGRKRKAP